MESARDEPLPLSEQRRERAQLYRLLAALHAGPLGVELVTPLRRQVRALFGIDLPAVAPTPPADLHRWAYGHCPGNPALGCTASSPAQCLPAKFEHLADSARKGAQQRRLREARFIRDELIPCLETNRQHMELAAYRDLMALSRAVVEADASRLEAYPDRY